MKYRFVWHDQKWKTEKESRSILEGHYEDNGYRGVRILGNVYLMDAGWRWSTRLEDKNDEDIGGVANSKDEGKMLVEESLAFRGIWDV